MILFLPLILQAAGLGLTAAASPGPLQTFLISRTLLQGRARAVPAVFAPLATDAILAPIILLLIGQLNESFLAIIRLAGALLLLVFARQTVRSLLGDDTLLDETQIESSAQHNFGWAVALNFVSPGPYLFWSLITGPIVIAAWKDAPAAAIAFILTFYAVFIGGMLGLILAFDAARRTGEQIVRALLWLSVAVFIAFAALLLWDGVNALLISG